MEERSAHHGQRRGFAIRRSEGVATVSAFLAWVLPFWKSLRNKSPEGQILEMRLRILAAGRTKDLHLRAIQQDLASRIEHFTSLSVEELPARQGASHSRQAKLAPADRVLLDRVRGARKILLDERGREQTSQEFAQWLGQEAVHGSRELVFLIGGPDGFSPAFRQQADVLLALSRMTLTRDWARTLLLEQIYRAFTILRGYPYAK